MVECILYVISTLDLFEKNEKWRYAPLKPDKGNNKKNAFGLISLILWALVLTLMFRSCTSSYNSSNQEHVPYSTFRQWVAEGGVR